MKQSRPAPSTPEWVKVLGYIVGALFLLVGLGELLPGLFGPSASTHTVVITPQSTVVYDPQVLPATVPQTAPLPTTAALPTRAPTLSEPAPEDACDVDAAQFLLFKQNGQYAIGLKNITVQNKGTWAKITNATIFVRNTGRLWLIEDVEVEAGDKNGNLNDIRKSTVSVNNLKNFHATQECFTADVTANIQLRNPQTIKTLTINLGEGGQYYGTTLASATGDFNLTRFMS